LPVRRGVRCDAKIGATRHPCHVVVNRHKVTMLHQHVRVVPSLLGQEANMAQWDYVTRKGKYVQRSEKTFTRMLGFTLRSHLSCIARVIPTTDGAADVSGR